MSMTLPIDSKERKNYPLFRGLLRYFPAALAGVARTSKAGNDKHNPGEEMHHARDKSSDHGDCILRHLMDTEDLLAGLDRGENITKEKILEEVSCLAWRALALSQELHEKFGAPLAPGAKKEVAAPTIIVPAGSDITQIGGVHIISTTRLEPTQEPYINNATEEYMKSEEFLRSLK